MTSQLTHGLEDLQDRVASWARTETLVRKAWLFGSRVRRDHRADSDLDVAVAVFIRTGDADEFTTALCEQAQLERRLQERFPDLTIDLCTHIEHDPGRVDRALAESSVLVFERQNGGHAT